MKLQFSAGGVVFKRQATSDKRKADTFILVAKHSQHHGWVFPKGLIDNKETKEQAALREVKEETGADGKIIKTLTPVTYWFVFEREKIRKTVYYFLMEFTGGDITKHDHEMEAVEWLDIEKVEERLTYKSDQKVWREAQNLI
ncbi:MAG: NUDIX hydrolase [Candidatus Levybacteria bacterium]|nr:NUDIX hydrolase [Candidatus Levybacteria bacterium]